MKSLLEYINEINAKPSMDAHVHLFDAHGDIFKYYTASTMMGFEHIDFRHLNEYTRGQMVDHYESFINNLNKVNSNILLLATGLSAAEIKEIHKLGGDRIKGFGELVCYDDYDDTHIGFKNIDFPEEILMYDSKLPQPLPVYIHYSLMNIDDKNNIDRLLTKYPNIPVELCHCGVPNKREYPNIHELDIHNIMGYFIELQKKHPNLWTDISDGSGMYFRENPNEIYLLDIYRTMIGSDITPSHFREHRQWRRSLERIETLSKIIPNNQNICTLFQL